ncbi:hypothetical protein [uncultured Cetobacterium sp.]|uniref:hypothetical protein n=1 Tax=uncultured Cetobacterium sp. TaxID=527638 RepID=UPI00263899E2|nr:hypothetical protein [uncultured Cetobacterium sp.]
MKNSIESLTSIQKIQPYLIYIDSIFYISGSVIEIDEFQRYIQNIISLSKKDEVIENYEKLSKNKLHILFGRYISIFSAKDIKKYINEIFDDRIAIKRITLLEGLENYNINNENFIDDYLEKSIYFDRIEDVIKKNFIRDDFE